MTFWCNKYDVDKSCVHWNWVSWYTEGCYGRIKLKQFITGKCLDVPEQDQNQSHAESMGLVQALFCHIKVLIAGMQICHSQHIPMMMT